MPVPTITSITPAEAVPSGDTLVEIIGTNFRMPTIPLSGPVGTLPPTVRVMFGATAGVLYTVVSATRLFVRTPKASLVGAAPDFLPLDELDVDVVVLNIDDDGNPIAGEEATETDGFTFRRPSVAADATSDIALASIALRRLFASETIGNVVIESNVDYDDDTSDTLTAVAHVPAIVLSGPKMADDSFYSRRNDVYVDGSGEYRAHRPGRSVMLTYDYLIVTQNTRQLQNIMSLVSLFLDRNRVVEIDGAQYYLDIDAEPSTTRPSGAAMKANIRHAVGRFSVRGFQVERVPGITGDGERGGGVPVLDDDDAILPEPEPFV